MSMKKYYPTAFALYMTYFVLGVAGSIMGQYKQELAALWGSGLLSDGTYDVSGVLAVIAALGLGRLISYPFAGPISDRFGRRVPALVGCALYFIFFAAVCYTRSYVLAYILGIVSGAANGFLDVSITPSCMEIFKEKGTIANIFTKLSISIAQFLLPFAIGFVAARALPYSTIFLFCAALIAVTGIALIFLPFPPYERSVKVKGEKKERMKFSPSAVILIILGFTTSTTFMIWLNCYQELAKSYGIADPSLVQSFYSVGIVLALFVNAALLAKGLKPSKILVIYPSAAVVTMVAVLMIAQPWINHSLTIGNLSDSEPEYVFTEEGGVLTRLELRIETGEDAIYISPPTSELQLAAMSLVWGREGMGALDLAERQELLRRIKAAGFGGFDFEAAGLRLFCEAEYAGEPTAFGLTAAEDGEPPCLKLVFRVTEAGM